MINIEHDCEILVDSFSDKFMTLNADKCHRVVFGHKNELMFANIGDATKWRERGAKILGKLTDFDLSFNDYVKMICTTASVEKKGRFRVTAPSTSAPSTLQY